MARKNLIAVNCASIDEVFRHIKDWLCARNGIVDYSASGLGWTLHDSSFAVNQDAPAANDWIVISSTGENGKQNLYYRMLFTTLASSIIRTRSGLHWNPSTDAWAQPYPNADVSGGPTTGSSFILYIYGSLDQFSIIIGNGTTLYGRHYGLQEDTFHDSTIAITTGDVAAGTGVVIPVDAVPASWSVGKSVIVRNLATIEKTTITAISGLNVTMTLANAYPAGARIARDYGTFISASTYFVSLGHGQINHSGTVGSVNNDLDGNFLSETLLAGDSDSMNSCHSTEYTELYDTNGTPGGRYGRITKDMLNVSSTGTVSGTVYSDDLTGDNYRALLVNSKMYLFREV